MIIIIKIKIHISIINLYCSGLQAHVQVGVGVWGSEPFNITATCSNEEHISLRALRPPMIWHTSGPMS